MKDSRIATIMAQIEAERIDRAILSQCNKAFPFISPLLPCEQEAIDGGYSLIGDTEQRLNTDMNRT